MRSFERISYCVQAMAPIPNKSPIAAQGQNLIFWVLAESLYSVM